MRPEIAEAERLAEVRRAARSWRKAGWIGAEAEAAIAARYADDRQRQGPALRTLFFLLTWFAISSGFGTFGLFLSVLNAPALLLFASGGVCIALAEFAYGRLRLLDYGPESALSWCGVGSLLGGFAWLLLETVKPGETIGLLTLLGIAAVVFGLGAWRWGSWLMGTLAGAALFGIFAGLPAGRWAWIVVGLLGAALFLRGSESDLCPSHRRVCHALLVLCLGGVAFAFMPASNEGHWIEKLGLRSADASPVPMVLAWAGSFALATGLVLFALATRRRLLLDVGALLGGAFVVMVLDAWDAQPYWAVLCGGGIGLIGGALLIRRFLEAGPEHERAGFTEAALLEDAESRRLLEMAAVLATASPAARELPAADAPGFQGKGGEFGGGGSSSGY